ncbi:protein serine/threonine kinase, putative [Entamoeba invadens IP1]|uniref:Protein serine/threonine kinase, putative n=1 Tax=Entamoeba invadens IP1 TaxID=370355 RepID=L7FJ27_ENTIV|nr:protein serine/threonine kinase, putative [Entamoeba invadens IP1]ELP83566.1 protein serine/threonine kinase, putative [Entamoeba invadens IP1]|eukprot:XP_004182912.1 protein serine/threonine kinase, putative [Entamoeba invadens IP1]
MNFTVIPVFELDGIIAIDFSEEFFEKEGGILLDKNAVVTLRNKKHIEKYHSFQASNNATLIIPGTLALLSKLTVPPKLKLLIEEDLSCNSDFVMSEGSILEVSGTLTLLKNCEMKENTKIGIKGEVVVQGATLKMTQSTLHANSMEFSDSNSVIEIGEGCDMTLSEITMGSNSMMSFKGNSKLKIESGEFVLKDDSLLNILTNTLDFSDIKKIVLKDNSRLSVRNTVQGTFKFCSELIADDFSNVLISSSSTFEMNNISIYNDALFTVTDSPQISFNSINLYSKSTLLISESALQLRGNSMVLADTSILKIVNTKTVNKVSTFNFKIELHTSSNLMCQSALPLSFDILISIFDESKLEIVDTNIKTSELLNKFTNSVGINLYNNSTFSLIGNAQMNYSKDVVLHDFSTLLLSSNKQTFQPTFFTHIIQAKDNSFITIPNNSNSVIAAQLIFSEYSKVDIGISSQFTINKPLITIDFTNQTCLLLLTSSSSFTMESACRVYIDSCVEMKHASTFTVKNESVLTVAKGIITRASDYFTSVIIIESTSRLYFNCESYDREYCRLHLSDVVKDVNCYSVSLSRSTVIEAPGRSIEDYPLFSSSNGIFEVDPKSFEKITSCVDIFSSPYGINILIALETFAVVGYDERVYRYCPSTMEMSTEVFCHMNGTQWIEGDEEETEYPYPFTHRHCPLPYDSAYVNHFNVIAEHTYINTLNENLNVNFVRKPVWITHNRTSKSVKHITGNVAGLFYINEFNITTGCPVTEHLNTSAWVQNTLTFNQSCINEKLPDLQVYTSALIIGTFQMRFVTTTDVIVSFHKNTTLAKEINTSKNLTSNIMAMYQHGVNFTRFNTKCAAGYVFYNKTAFVTQLKVLSDVKTVCESDEAFNEVTKTCQNCHILYGNACQKCVSDTCTLCDLKYRLDSTGHCTSIEKCLIYSSSYCVECESGYWADSQCVSCQIGCQKCTKSGCTLCENNSSLILNGNCVPIPNSLIIVPQTIIACERNYYSTTVMCALCTSKYPNCEECNTKSCLKCNLGYVLIGQDGSYSCQDMHCKTIKTPEKCLECSEEYFLNIEGDCVPIIEHCRYYDTTKCIECDSPNYYLVNNKCTTNESETHCYQSTQIGCVECVDGYYSDGSVCNKCNTKCKKCVSTFDTCTSCITGASLIDNKCVTVFSLEGICLQFNQYGFCTACNTTYYVSDGGCLQCTSPCHECLSSGKCTNCISNYYLLDNGKCELISSILHCKTAQTNIGCVICDDGFYLKSKICVKCGEECISCTSESLCLNCSNNKMIENGACVDRMEIKGCTTLVNSYCEKCDFWKMPSEDKTNCKSHVVWWVILLLTIVAVVILIVTILIVIYIAIVIMRHKEQHIRYTKYHIFMLKKAIHQIEYFPLNTESALVMSPKELSFSPEAHQIPVDEDTSLQVIIGNVGNSPQKIQFVTFKRKRKYILKFSPKVVVLRRGEACEFTLTIHPICSLKIRDKIGVVSCALKTGNEKVNEVSVFAETMLSTKLDKDNLKEISVIGEGSFGVVFKGTFNDQIVAIKRIRTETNRDDAFEEFEKEVSMLDKFRCEYIVHFYGACFLPNYLCLVTELAEFGSIQDVKDKMPIDIYPLHLKTKLMVDAAKGVEYLHINGIFHRDIKPANILVTSLAEGQKVNAKLTDFGSSRNVNCLKQNSTFTKGIGTPLYMAPEVLITGKYGFESDTYSFGMSLYEVIGWCSAFSECRYVWNIASKTSNGERPAFSPNHKLFEDVIASCWRHEIKQRISMSEVVQKLEIIYENLNQNTDKNSKAPQFLLL